MPKHKKALSGATSRIAHLRNELGLTQAQLAVLVGVTNNTIQNWEKGRSGVDQIEKFLKLCEVLDCKLKDLIAYDDHSGQDNQQAGEFTLDDLRDLRERWKSRRNAKPGDGDEYSEGQSGGYEK